jgi:multidrug efflux pump subunit AcrA (membrane-fusion protein)
MSNKNKNNATAVSVVALQSTFDTALIVLNALGKTIVTPEEKAEAQTAFDTAFQALGALDEAATIEEKTAAQTIVDTAKEALAELSTAEEVAEAQAVVTAAKEALDKSKLNTPVKDKVEVLEIEFLISPTGRFGLGYNVGEKGKLPKLQAEELVEAGYAKFTK